jgi:hypothetical protein
MKFKILIVCLFLLVYSCKKQEEQEEISVPEPEVTTIEKDLTSIDFLPEEYQKFFYFKDSKTAYKGFEESQIYKALKDNYLFLDLKYNYLENVDMFFTRFNFDFNSIFNYIDGDVTFGIENNSFFLIASMTWESKLFISLLNIAPNSIISESEYNKLKIYSVEKGLNSIYYSVLNGYVVFSDNDKGLKECIDSAINSEVDYKTYSNGIDDTEMVYVTKIDLRNNPLDIFPQMSQVKFKYNTVSHSLSYTSLPTKEFEEYIDREDEMYHETLKYFNKDTPLVLYNSSYNFKNIISSLVSEDEGSRFDDIIETLDQRIGGIYFLVEDLEPLISDSNPGLGFILNIKQGEDELSEVLDLTSSILGITWSDGATFKDVTDYTSENSSFHMVISANNIGIFTKSKLALNFKSQIINPEYSLYDKHKDSFYNDNTTLDSFICYNPEEIKKSTEMLIKRYIFSSINMSEDEYNKSFGEVINLVSNLKSGYMDYMFDKENGEFYGSIKKLP